jgi:Putative Ig domain/IPT/TIG domain
MLALLLGGASAAQAVTTVSPQWAHLTPPASPPAGFTDPIAYDAATKQLVLYDGSSGETWIWDGSTWTPVPQLPSSRPPKRSSAVMAYDAGTGQLILFGGNGSSGPLNDTWSWSATGWSQLSPGTSPPPTTQASMGYDGATGQMVLFGGQKFVGGQGMVSSDTWTWDGTTWSLKAPSTSPPSRLGAAMAYDPSTSQLLLFGGVSAGTSLLRDTWNWNGSTWSRLTPASNPSARSFPAMAYDSTTGQLVMTGGAVGITTSSNDTWTWSGSTWVRQAPASSVNPPRYGAALADDPNTGGLVLFGGAVNATTAVGDTWMWTTMAVQTATLPAGAVGHRYLVSLQAVAGKRPYTWSVSAGALPPGLSLSTAGAITGTPTSAGSTTFTVTALDSTLALPQKATRSLTVKINPSPQPAVWVGNGANSDINQFSLTASGNAPPMATLAGPLTGVSGIGSLAFDSAGQLWVASSGGAAIEQFPPGASGNVAPSRVLSGPDTMLTDPAGIAFDASGRLYVVNPPSQAIAVYPAGASGNTPPQRTISGPDTGLSTPVGITIDHSGHIWVANQATSSLTEYASTASGDAAPLNTIAGPATSLNTPQGLGLNSAGDVLVANFFGGSALTFADSGPFGDVAPKASISGSQSQLHLPQAVDVDTAGRTYVADGQAGLAIFPRGSSTPATVLTNLAIKSPGAVAVAPPFEVTTGALPRAALGRRYTGRLMAILGKSPLRWRRVRGHLPRGLRLSRDGRISGVARRVGRYRFTVSATDSERRRQSARATITLSVGRAPTVSGLSRTHGSRRGGRTVRITGTGFARARNATIVAFGRIRAPHVTCHSSTGCTVRTPPGRRGAISVRVTVGGLTSAGSRAARYRYTR